MNKVKAITTIYNGYKFRSRLEARWAVFFDNANIEYEYEPEGYISSNGVCYLPDFYLPKLDVYVEVKRNTNDIEDDLIKCYNSIEWGGPIKRILFLTDIPNVNVNDGMWCFPIIYYGANGKSFGWWQFCDSRKDDDSPCLPCDGYILEREYDKPFCVIYDDKDKKIIYRNFSDNPLSSRGESFLKENSILYQYRIEKDKELYRLQGKDGNYEIFRKCDSDVAQFENPYFFQALDKARQARFEHGEKG